MNKYKISCGNTHKKVIWFFGINGVGKSSLIKEILKQGNNNGIKIQAIFQAITGFSSRSELEKIPAITKYELLEKTLLKRINSLNQKTDYILIDSHLMVPIRNRSTTHYECMWSNKFIALSNKTYMIVADPHEILKRRISDKKLSGRKRDCNLENIKHDQKVNKIMFASLLKPVVPTKILETTNYSIKEIAYNIIKNL